MESKPVVTVLGKSYIPPATPTKRDHFFLSCLDIFWQDVHYNQRVIFYKSSPQELSSVFEALKTSLSLVLVHYYPWAGRLALGKDRRLVIDCNDLGAEFVEASIDLPISELEKDDFQMKVFFDNLCQHLDQKNEHLYTSPLLSLQATRFSDGGLAIGVTQSHVVADGLSLWNFLVSWGECARGEALSLEPVHDRALLAVHDPSPEKAFLKFGADIQEGDGSFSWEKVISFSETDSVTEQVTENGPTTGTVAATEKTTEHDGMSGNGAGSGESWIEKSGRAGGGRVQGVFYMSEASIKKLKSEAAETTGKKFSSFVVLCAHFWQRASIARQRPSTEAAGIGILVNNRQRLTPPLSPAYFGNAVTFTMGTTDAGTITQESLGAVAARIQAGIAGATEESVRGFMNWLELHDNHFLSKMKITGELSLLNIASSPWFPAYEVDFGWGKPAAVRPAKIPGEGELVLFGGRPGSLRGDVEICISLSSQAMQNLLSDPKFLASYPITPPTTV